MAMRRKKKVVTLVDLLIAHELQPMVDSDGTTWWECRADGCEHRVRANGQPIRRRNAEHQADAISKAIQAAR